MCVCVCVCVRVCVVYRNIYMKNRESMSHYLAMTGLKIPMYTKLASNSKKFTFLYFGSPRIKGLHHQAQLSTNFCSNFII